MKNRLKRILCIIKAHPWQVDTYDDWQDDIGRHIAGIKITCPKCDVLIWSAPKEYIISKLKKNK